MSATGEEPDLSNRLGVVFVGMDEFLGYVVLHIVALARQFDVKVCIQSALKVRRNQNV